jgi:hypothetical protein
MTATLVSGATPFLTVPTVLASVAVVRRPGRPGWAVRSFFTDIKRRHRSARLGARLSGGEGEGLLVHLRRKDDHRPRRPTCAAR